MSDGFRRVSLKVDGVDPKDAVAPRGISPLPTDLRKGEDIGAQESFLRKIDVGGAGLHGYGENDLENFVGKSGGGMFCSIAEDGASKMKRQ